MFLKNQNRVKKEFPLRWPFLLRWVFPNSISNILLPCFCQHFTNSFASCILVSDRSITPQSCSRSKYPLGCLYYRFCVPFNSSFIVIYSVYIHIFISSIIKLYNTSAPPKQPSSSSFSTLCHVIKFGTLLPPKQPFFTFIFNTFLFIFMYLYLII
jgi:hypothetical protein